MDCRCAIGSDHTICVAENGTLYSIGGNTFGQLGLGQNNYTLLPCSIPNFPQVKHVSCGRGFTFCVDFDGGIWSFGHNGHGELGIGSNQHCNTPQKIQDIPLVSFVSCGGNHALIVTNDDNLWSVGKNSHGQLFLGNQNNQTKPQQTSFSNILDIAAGDNHSICLNRNGEIYGCGFNSYGQLGFKKKRLHCIEPSRITRNVPSNIIKICCGFNHSLLLDIEGNVYSVGYNYEGSLGLGNYLPAINCFNRIKNIPPIHKMICSIFSSFLLDFDGNVWVFGSNSYGELGLGDGKKYNVPIKNSHLKGIKQISSGPIARCILAKDYEDKIFLTGKGHLDNATNQITRIPQELDPQFFDIWGVPEIVRAKSARK